MNGGKHKKCNGLGYIQKESRDPKLKSARTTASKTSTVKTTAAKKK
jgi:hypothetical protein